MKKIPKDNAVCPVCVAKYKTFQGTLTLTEVYEAKRYGVIRSLADDSRMIVDYNSAHDRKIKKITYRCEHCNTELKLVTKNKKSYFVKKSKID